MVDLSFVGLRRHPVLLCGLAYAETLARLDGFFECKRRVGQRFAMPSCSRNALRASRVIAMQTAGIDAALLSTLPHLKTVCKVGPSHADIDLCARTHAGVMATNTLDLQGFAIAAHRAAGFELWAVQRGSLSSDWKATPPWGAGAYQIRIHVLGEWSVIYVAKFTKSVYVLRAFRKKAQKARGADVALVARRFRQIEGER